MRVASQAKASKDISIPASREYDWTCVCGHPVSTINSLSYRGGGGAVQTLRCTLLNLRHDVAQRRREKSQRKGQTEKRKKIYLKKRKYIFNRPSYLPVGADTDEPARFYVHVKVNFLHADVYYTCKIYVLCITPASSSYQFYMPTACHRIYFIGTFVFFFMNGKCT